MVTITIEGKDYEELGKKVDAYLSQYPPQGYGTSIKSIDGKEFDEDGHCIKIVATITRGDNCD